MVKREAWGRNDIFRERTLVISINLEWETGNTSYLQVIQVGQQLAVEKDVLSRHHACMRELTI